MRSGPILVNSKQGQGAPKLTCSRSCLVRTRREKYDLTRSPRRHEGKPRRLDAVDAAARESTRRRRQPAGDGWMPMPVPPIIC